MTMTMSNDATDAIAARLLTEFSPESIRVEGDGSHFQITVISDVFSGLSKIKRQQLVYRLIGDLIQQGTVHAVQLTTQTPLEAAKPSSQ